ncbi:hypothetical protein KAU08_02640 [bacterium]|jgi:hypothetical protein|nr:hypothetical protein [bacterium]
MDQDQADRDPVQEEDRDRDRAAAEDGWGDQREDPAGIVFVRHAAIKSRTRWANRAIS